MRTRTRQFSLGIWGLGFGYFLSYIPYSGLIKVITEGTFPGMAGTVSGFELLPSTLIATALIVPLFITFMGWWKYAGRRRVFGLILPIPNRMAIISGTGTALIIGTTTLAYTFSGVSILFALLLLRAGVLILAPIVDSVFRRRVRWFSWVALALSFLALGVALADVQSYHMTLIAALNVCAYLIGYMLRLPCINMLAKSSNKEITYRYFVEEQIVMVPVLVGIPALFALIGQGPVMMDLRRGFTTFFGSEVIIPALLIGVLYACLFVFGSLIYLDRRENTFCIPLNRCSSLLSGLVVSYLLFFLLHTSAPSGAQLTAAGLIIVALMFLSPLHHLREYSDNFVESVACHLVKMAESIRGLSSRTQREIANAVAEQRAISAERLRRVFLFVCSGNTCRSPMAEAIGNYELAVRLGLSYPITEDAWARALSAGVSARPGSPMTEQARRALLEMGITPHAHVSRHLTAEIIEEAEVIYCMTESHRTALLEMFPAAAGRAECLDSSADIDDPMGAGPEIYASCARRIQDLIRKRFDEAEIGGGLLAHSMGD